jgi:superfamily I DNA/RNA helicase
LLANVESALAVAIERLPFGHPELGGGSGVLKREINTAYIRHDVSGAEAAYLIAHELGHWFLDGDRPAQTITHLSSMTASYGSQATVAVEAYGARERLELQANVFARELLLPRAVANQLFQGGMGANAIAARLQVPLEIVRLQLYDGVLLPILALAPPLPLPAMTHGQQVAATASETFVNVVAGPGTGKTTTLIHRIKHLVEQGVPASRILVLTFTNKAAHELVERLKASEIAGASEVWAGTFHAFGLEFLRKYHHLFNLDPDVRIADTLMQVRLMVRTLPKVQLKYYLRLQNPYDWLPGVMNHIKRLKEECLTVADYRARLAALPPCDADIADEREDIATLFEAYEAAMRAEHLVDYVDLIAMPSIQAKGDRTSVVQYIDHFHHLLVDEYQDVTEVMVDLLRQLALNARSVWVVGDVRQAIHHWRGASIRSLIAFDATFRSNIPGANVRRYNLDLNRRSTPQILELFTCAGVHHALTTRMPLEHVNAHRPSISILPALYECGSKGSQAVTIAQRINGLVQQGISYRDQVVISRKSADVEQAVEALTALGIPVLHVGDLCQRPEIKKLLCLMELLCMRQPRSLVGLIAEPFFRMPPQDIEHLIHLTRKGSGTNMQRGRWLWQPVPGLSAAGQQAKANLARLLHGLKRNSRPWDFVSKVLLDQRYGIPPAADQSIPAHTKRLALWLFAYAVRNGDGDAKEARLSQFLLREELRRRIGEKLGDRGMPPETRALDAVSVMTVHASKGLEYAAVHVTDVDDASYGEKRPYSYDMRGLVLLPPEILNSTAREFMFEEQVERNNLLYVALSRARDYLYLYEVGDSPRPLPLARAGATCLTKRAGVAAPLAAPVVAPPAAHAVVTPVTYEAFQTYLSCPLQYHYRHELALTAEQDIDVSVRARWAIMDMLLAFARDGADPNAAFRAAWESHRLPNKAQDPGLMKDAIAGAKRGLAIVRSLGGTVVEGLVAEVQGVKIELPWMLSYTNQLHWIRGQSGIQYTLGQLRPMMLNINGSRVGWAKIYSLITDKNVSEGPSKKPDQTTVFKMARRFAAGDRSAAKGRSCAHCPYLSICSNTP